MKAALFDLDETLLDRTGSLRLFASWQAQEMLKNCGCNPSKFTERFLTLDEQGRVWKDRVYKQLVNEFGITGWSVDDLLNSYLLTFCAFCTPRHGAEKAVMEFKENCYKIVLVTNGKTPFQERNFRALGLSHYFDDIVVSEAVGMRKPDKAIFELACNRVGANINESVFIGDNPVSDIEGAKKSGMQTIYTPAELDYPSCDFADLTVQSLSKIVGFCSTQQ